MISSDATRPDLTVVIPAYNEEKRLADTLLAVITYLDQRDGRYEIVVVDDGSDDATATVAEGFGPRGVQLERLPYNQGKGAATRRGVLASRGQLVLLTDADLSTPIAELPKLEAHLGDADLVLGSRAVRGSRITRHQPLYRELMGKTFNKIVRLAGVRGISDTQCGFKLLKGEPARSLFADLVTPGFAFDVELVWLARRRGYRVVEVGVTWENSPSSRVHPLSDPPRMLMEIARFRRHHRGKE